MIIDVHAHCGYMFFPIRIEKEDEIVNLLDKYKIDKCIISHIKGIFYDFRGANEELLKGMRKYPSRLYGYVIVNPNYLDESLAEIEKYAKIENFVGVKLHPMWHATSPNSKPYRLIFEKCEELKLPVLVHSFDPDTQETNISAPEKLAQVAGKYTIPIIMAHLGGNEKRGVQSAKHVENLYVDISGGRQDADQQYVWSPQRIELAVGELGPERVLFGTDLPLIDPSITLGMMRDAQISEKEKDMIFYLNAQRIFKL